MEACWVATCLNDRRKYLQISKKTRAQALILGDYEEGSTPQLCQNICLLNI